MEPRLVVVLWNRNLLLLPQLFSVMLAPRACMHQRHDNFAQHTSSYLRHAVWMQSNAAQCKMQALCQTAIQPGLTQILCNGFKTGSRDQNKSQTIIKKNTLGACTVLQISPASAWARDARGRSPHLIDPKDGCQREHSKFGSYAHAMLVHKRASV